MVSLDFSEISGGTITTPAGYQAGAAYAGIKTYSDVFSTDLEKLDLEKLEKVNQFIMVIKYRRTGMPSFLC